MSAASTFVLLAYIVALLSRWSQNHSMVVGSPVFLMDWTRRTIYMVITFVLTYGSIIGVGYFFGIWAGLVALSVKLIVGRVSFHHYFKHAVGEHAEWEYQQLLKDRTNANVSLEKLDTMERFTRISSRAEDLLTDESVMRAEAYRRSHEAVGNRVRRG